MLPDENKQDTPNTEIGPGVQTPEGVRVRVDALARRTDGLTDTRFNANFDSEVLDALPATLRLAARGNKTVHVDGNDTPVPGPDQSDAIINQAQFRQNAYNE
ncbi:hypothetical protein GNZ12_37415 [Paraburkholderia sp. 1N]|uniref:Uncharacterized protein n=1 Tax=Paraburkholderia solitsugae TaxID=2675748 RepID=A0ABX2C4G2_9BURK|nr:hypothetical protein [Paraburkholderia solitsugae]NPT46890.1 hypothetical protein [Paraburkholderia solitsugae]